MRLQRLGLAGAGRAGDQTVPVEHRQGTRTSAVGSATPSITTDPSTTDAAVRVVAVGDA
jgi:hypothetical protein